MQVTLNQTAQRNTAKISCVIKTQEHELTADYHTAVPASNDQYITHRHTGLVLTNLFSFFSGGDFMSHPVHTTSPALIAAASVCVCVRR